MSVIERQDGVISSMWYSACGTPPSFAQWISGPNAQSCYYSCLYGSSSGIDNVFLYDMGQGDLGKPHFSPIVAVFVAFTDIS